MKIHPRLIAPASFLILASSAAVASSFDGELNQPKAQHEKGVAAAIEPLKRRYQTSLELLLKRAMQANDLDAATKIKQAMSELQYAGSGVEGAGARPHSKGELEKVLVGTSWTFGNAGAATIKFIAPGRAQLDAKEFTWEPVDAKTIKLGTATLIFTRDLTSYECPNWFGQGAISGKRKAQ